MLFFLLVIKNSVGNITDILHQLDDNVYTGEEILQNYQMLIEKWGQWELGEGSGVAVRYVDIGNALFSGLAITYATLTFVFLVIAIVFGKLVFPLLHKHYTNMNEELVDITTIRSAEQINGLAEHAKKKEWF